MKAHEEAAPARDGTRPLLLMDGLSCSPFDYYTRDHAVAREDLRDFFKKKVESVCLGRGTRDAKRKIKASVRRGFWLIVSKPTYVEPLEEHVRSRCTPDVLMHLPGPSLLAHCAPRP
jgi:hypothetical protein